MSKKLVSLSELGKKLGLGATQDGNIFFGLRKGYPIKLSLLLVGKVENVVFELNHETPSIPKNLVSELVELPALKQLKIKKSVLSADEGRVFYFNEPSMMGKFDVAEMETRVLALEQELHRRLKTPTTACGSCKVDGKAELLLLNEQIGWACPSCLSTMQHNLRKAAEDYEAKPTRWLVAMIAGAVAAVLGAALWAGVAVATGKLYAMIAVVIGFGVMWSMALGAGKGGRAVQMMGVVFTIFGVLMGVLGHVGYYTHLEAVKQQAQLDWMQFLQAAPSIWIEMAADTGFAFFCALLGALGSLKLAARPDFELKIERSGHSASKIAS